MSEGVSECVCVCVCVSVGIDSAIVAIVPKPERRSPQAKDLYHGEHVIPP